MKLKTKIYNLVHLFISSYILYKFKFQIISMISKPGLSLDQVVISGMNSFFS